MIKQILKNRPGLVYLVKVDDENFKIGQTKDLKQRLTHLSYEYKKVELIHTIETNDKISHERYLHWFFSCKALDGNGELFDLSDDDIKIFKSRNSFFYDFNKDSSIFLWPTPSEEDELLYSAEDRLDVLHEFLNELSQEERLFLNTAFPSLSEEDIKLLLDRYFEFGCKFQRRSAKLQLVI